MLNASLWISSALRPSFSHAPGDREGRRRAGSAAWAVSAARLRGVDHSTSSVPPKSRWSKGFSAGGTKMQTWSPGVSTVLPRGTTRS